MGYRSTFVTEHIYIKFPDWFIEKWKDAVHFQVRPEGLYGGGAGDLTLPISSKFERKFYSGAEEPLFLDLARVLREHEEEIDRLRLVIIHEDGEVDRVIVTPHKITLEGSLEHDPRGGYNPRLGDRNETYIIPTELLETEG